MSAGYVYIYNFSSPKVFGVGFCVARSDYRAMRRPRIAGRVTGQIPALSFLYNQSYFISPLGIMAAIIN